MSVLVETTIGDIVIDLFLRERPRCCLNFLKLVKLKYYNFSSFHTIEQNYVAQCGDPTGTGRGGESIFSQLYGEQAKFFEMEAVPKLRHRWKGLVSMVNNGDDMHGSQFFITLGDELDYLDGKHTVFGMVSEGMDVLDRLNGTICDERNRPYRDVRISHAIILDDPFDDPVGLVVPSRSPTRTPDDQLLKTSRLVLDEDFDDSAGKTKKEIQEEIEKKEATARAHILEMVGDLHYAEEKPADNVLFVCKLNAVTTEEDLEIIFSRFGTIKCCEVIKDRKTGNSLQYAFIEFERVEDCETAYFKMDNVLIDDRRVHVDFSQSVSKNFQWKKEVSTKGAKNQEGDKKQRDQKGAKTSSWSQEASVSRERRRRRSSTPPRRKRPAADDRGRREEERIPPRREDRSRERNSVRRRTNRSPSDSQTRRQTVRDQHSDRKHRRR